MALILQAWAQGFTFRWSGGYAGGVGSDQNIYGPFINTQMPTIDKLVPMANSNDATGGYSSVKGTYGRGGNIGMRFGYMFNDYVGVDLGVYYNQSTTISCSQTHSLFYPNDTTGALQNTGDYLSCNLSAVSRSVTLSPSVIASFAKPSYKFYPYMRAGLTLPVWTQITNTTNISLVGAGAIYDPPYFLGSYTAITMQTRGAFTVGFNGAVGAVYKAYPFLHLFVELNGQYLAVKATSSVVTGWVADGNDLSGERGAYRNQVNYVSKLSSSSNNAQYNANYNPNQPKQDYSPVFPFSNIGFNVGVQLYLTTKAWKDQDAFEENHQKKKAAKAKKKPTEETPATTEPPKTQ